MHLWTLPSPIWPRTTDLTEILKSVRHPDGPYVARTTDRTGVLKPLPGVGASDRATEPGQQISQNYTYFTSDHLCYQHQIHVYV